MSWEGAWIGLQDAAAYEAGASYRRLMAAIYSNPPDVQVVFQMYGDRGGYRGDGSGAAVTDEELRAAFDEADRRAFYTHRNPGLTHAEETPTWLLYQHIRVVLFNELARRGADVPQRVYMVDEAAPNPQDAGSEGAQSDDELLLF